ncbi:DUF5004 domain-containing protein [Flavobacterium johnsoniae]|jgi:hypothetical protein|uniref:Hypothetical lipoprotein n=1 Tax=Flavobacterium johnsoniae (strain ATCC 17061 / DSM 2064 / JCM 8514 / BCRC 14874 / CCUG 350202 / NBRC 14942 / NCIMB 11054 / UW101) TaxID=376686 RepID=A5FBT5_FLAJ1|nr:DUF5004 domain-containing protein [Flavobacterium johnsoniae]ABQ07339.1 hypothetical lipoprotein [Flavobacterium johnsoniae UW101]OXE99250.1 DUF5004 domain-containing protein [Flavobacterium johnsoniae UW101]WQG80827.1 DUF5004 domain-containing protein [Flavobacterium johnsoniae UW101]SHL16084.1 protein of unknown function [Flavobacterium johnsoniae]
MRSKSYYWLALFMCFFAISCDNTEDGSYVDPITIYEKVNGNWGLTNLKMVDEFAKTNKIEPNEENLSTFFNYEDFKINFSVDEKNRPTSYEVTGNVPPLFALKGYWELSSDFQQTNASAVKIYLYSDAQKTQKTDELRLSSVPGKSGEMEFQLVRSSEGTAFLTYVFKLNAIN